VRKSKKTWHKNLADRADVSNFFRPLKAKFADAKMKKSDGFNALFFIFLIEVRSKKMGNLLKKR